MTAMEKLKLPTVLVVDDEVRSLEALRRTLEEDFEVFTASSAEEAQTVMEREWVQIIVCDQRMPGMTGVEFLKEFAFSGRIPCASFSRATPRPRTLSPASMRRASTST